MTRTGVRATSIVILLASILGEALLIADRNFWGSVLGAFVVGLWVDTVVEEWRR